MAGPERRSEKYSYKFGQVYFEFPRIILRNLFNSEKFIPCRVHLGSRRLRFPEFIDNLQMKLYAPATFTPKSYTYYSFLLQAVNGLLKLIMHGDPQF
jgi:hypothetical protein